MCPIGFERSISVYWALLRKLSEGGVEPGGVPLVNRSEEIDVVNR